MKNEVTLYGHHAVLAALKNPQREVRQILCSKENYDEVSKLADTSKIKITDKKDLDKLLGANCVHQGVAAVCTPLETYNIEDIIALANKQNKCHVLILDQVTDSQNIGAIIRSAVAFNTLALVVQDKNSPEENGAIAKAAVGTIEKLPIVRATNLSRTIEKLKDAGFWVVGLDGHAKQSISELNKSGKTVIVMGSEGKGMRRLVEENCDITVKIEMADDVESLNVSTATAIVLYEINKG